MMRASGLLMHISSLPGDHGIGKLGKDGSQRCYSESNT